MKNKQLEAYLADINVRAGVGLAILAVALLLLLAVNLLINK